MPAWDAAFGSVSRIARAGFNMAEGEWDRYLMDRWLTEASVAEFAVLPIFVLGTLGLDQHWEIERLQAALADDPPGETSGKTLILRNAVKCRKCGEVIESKEDRHDFVTCKCGAVSVDGGLDYLRRIGEPEDYEELSEWSEP